MRLGVLGGSFNPVHWGHLHVALLAREAGELDQVLFVPAARPPHKTTSLASGRDRLALLEAALATEPGTAVSTVELEPGGPRYTVDTLARIRDLNPGARISFIVGLDSLLELHLWRAPETIVGDYRLIVVDRPGLDPGKADPELARRCLMVGGNPLGISATGIRNRVARDRPIRHLVPSAVEEIIRTRGLYRSGDPSLRP